MSISFKCPECSQPLEADTGMVGQELSCPSCNGTITVPVQNNITSSPQQVPSTSTLSIITPNIQEESMKPAKGVSEKKHKDFILTRYFSLMVNIVENLIEILRKPMAWLLSDKTERTVVSAGHVFLFISFILCFIIAVLLMVKYKTMGYSLPMFGSMIVFVFVIYIAEKFLTSCKSILSLSESRMTSLALTDCLAIIFFIMSLLALSSWLYAYLYETVSVVYTCSKLLDFVTLGLCAGIALNLQQLNIKLDKKISAGEEVIGIFIFFTKLFLKITPFVYAVGIVIGFIILACGLIKWSQSSISTVMVTFASKIIIFSALFPLFVYLLFLISCLLIDIIRTFLSLPGKLEIINSSLSGSIITSNRSNIAIPPPQARIPETTSVEEEPRQIAATSHLSPEKSISSKAGGANYCIIGSFVLAGCVIIIAVIFLAKYFIGKSGNKNTTYYEIQDEGRTNVSNNNYALPIQNPNLDKKAQLKILNRMAGVAEGSPEAEKLKGYVEDSQKIIDDVERKRNSGVPMNPNDALLPAR